jgi:hypothetical protein
MAKLLNLYYGNSVTPEEEELVSVIRENIGVFAQTKDQIHFLYLWLTSANEIS